MTVHAVATEAAPAEVPVEKKTRKATGPRTWKPVQVVLRVTDAEGKPLSRKHARVEVLTATKDELSAARALREAIDNDDASVQVVTVQIAN